MPHTYVADAAAFLLLSFQKIWKTCNFCNKIIETTLEMQKS